jgi:hypothetical protein
MMISLESGRFGWDFVIEAEDGRTVYVQTDWDYPGVASSFGWAPCCDATDGTVDCEHGTAMDHINAAREYLDAHIGDVVEDPGYFSED